MMVAHALVTGAGSGIGAAVARRLAADGLNVTLLGRRVEPLRAIAAAAPTSMQEVAADVTDAAALAAAFARARDRFGPVSVLVNNAGQAASAPFLKGDAELWRQMMAVNLDGPVLCIREALPSMIESGWGRIITVASTAGLVGYAYVSAYCAAKHAVIGLTRSLAIETASRGVTVNAVCPGFTETEIVRDSIARIVARTGRTPAEARAELVKGNPQGRLVDPSEVADAVAWLAGPGSSAVTGQSISVSGGEVT